MARLNQPLIKIRRDGTDFTGQLGARFYIIDRSREASARSRSDKSTNPFPANREHRWCWEYSIGSDGRLQNASGYPCVDYMFTNDDYVAYIHDLSLVDGSPFTGSPFDRYQWHTLDPANPNQCYSVSFDGNDVIILYTPSPPPPPETPYEEVHVVYDSDVMINGFKTSARKKYIILYPAIKVLLDKRGFDMAHNESLTLKHSDTPCLYTQTLSISTDGAIEGDYIALKFSKVPKDLNYTLQLEPGTDDSGTSLDTVTVFSNGEFLAENENSFKSNADKYSVVRKNNAAKWQGFVTIERTRFKNIGIFRLFYRDHLSQKKQFPKFDNSAISLTVCDASGGAESTITDFTNDTDGKISFSCSYSKKCYRFVINFPEKCYLVSPVDGGDTVLMKESEVHHKITLDNHFLMQNNIFLLPQKLDLNDFTWTAQINNTDTPVYTILPDDKTAINKMYTEDPKEINFILEIDWQHFKFQYYNLKVHEMYVAGAPAPDGESSSVPGYLLLKGYNNGPELETASNYCILSTDKLDNIFCLPWFKKTSKLATRDAGKIDIKFQTSDMYINLQENRIETKSPEMMKSLRDDSVKTGSRDCFKFYDLPAEFEAKNWWVEFKGSDRSFKDVANEKTMDGGAITPIIFDLDSVVLTDDSCKYLPQSGVFSTNWVADDRFTVFNMQMDVINQDHTASEPHNRRPYWSRGKFERNFFTRNRLRRGRDMLTRLIALNGKFYDVTYKRCITAGKDGEAVGARAAVLNDGDVHYGDSIKRMSTTDRFPYLYQIGNYELHLLAHCIDNKKNPCGVLLIYWSAKVEKGDGVTDEQYKSFLNPGMINAKSRWERKDFWFASKDGDTGKMEVRPVFFFEGREKDPYKCTIKVLTKTDPSYMMWSSSEMAVGEHAPQSGGTGDFVWFTMAHELGHAMGLDDEYFYSLKVSGSSISGLPEYSQYYPGMPYSCEGLLNANNFSIMDENQHPRLRHLWHFCKWLNGESKVKSITGNLQFMIRHYSNIGMGHNEYTVRPNRRPAEIVDPKHEYRYFLEDDANNIYKPYKKQENFTREKGVAGAGSKAKFDLFLYRVGDDESNRALNLRDSTGLLKYHYILVIRVNIQWFFENKGSDKWTLNEKFDYLTDLRRVTLDPFRRDFRFYLEDGITKQRAYIYLSPHHYFESGTFSDHCKITVLKSDTTIPSTESIDFKIGNFQQRRRIIRKVLGLEPSAVEIPDVEFRYLTDWIKNQLGSGVWSVKRSL